MSLLSNDFVCLLFCLRLVPSIPSTEVPSPEKMFDDSSFNTNRMFI